MSAIEKLRADMGRAGLNYAGPIIPDGKLHRFKAEGDHNRNSWYVLFARPIMAGAYGCWKRGLKEDWHERDPGEMSQAEWSQVRQHLQDAKSEKARAEAERQEKARKTAAWILKRARRGQCHPYLVTKGTKIFGEAREYRGALVLPLRDWTGELQSLQFISTDGTKKFLSGGRVAECLFTLADKQDSPLVICEGYATGASIYEGTDYAVVCAMNCGNLWAAAKALRAKWPQRDIIIAADDDRWTEGNPGRTKAEEAAKSIHARLAVPQFKDTTSKPTDFNDLHQLEGPDTVKAQIEAARRPIETDVEWYTRLAKLTQADYDRVRIQEAEGGGIRVGTLDTEVEKRRPKEQKPEAVQGAKVEFAEIEPWAEPVNLASLLDEIEAILRRFVVATDAAIVAATLFVLHTYAYDLGDISPILFITGPTKRCGKSKLLAILSRMVWRAFTAASATAAGFYRTIELHHPTLCIDEVDAFVRGDEQLRGLINAGHTRDAAFHLGCVTTGEKVIEPRRWSTWTPKIFSGIGRLADTIEDRAFILEMRRRNKNEPIERLRYGMRFDEIQRKALRFVKDNEAAIRNGNPAVPEELNDRAGDNWRTLLIFAEMAGREWEGRAQKAALAMAGRENGEALGVSSQVLADIRELFTEKGVKTMASKELAEGLRNMEGRPWAEYGKSHKAISPNQIANLLRGYQISPKTIRFGAETAKGYELEQFAEAFSRYLEAEGLPKGNNVTNAVSNSGASTSDKTANVTAKNALRVENDANHCNDNVCHGVTVGNGQSLQEDKLLI